MTERKKQKERNESGFSAQNLALAYPVIAITHFLLLPCSLRKIIFPHPTAFLALPSTAQKLALATVHQVKKKCWLPR